MELLEEIIDTALLAADEPAASLVKMASSLVESVPMDYLMTNESLAIVEKKVSQKLGLSSELSREKVMEELSKMSSESKFEIMEILDIILERVIDMGNE